MRKYKAEDGSYLGIDEQDGAYRIAWFIPEDGEFGAYVGDRDLSEEMGSGTDEDKKSMWEVMTADAAAKPFSCGKNSYGYEFENEKQAKLALLAANTSLLTGGAPMPEWATKAMAAGWKPPHGWKP